MFSLSRGDFLFAIRQMKSRPAESTAEMRMPVKRLLVAIVVLFCVASWAAKSAVVGGPVLGEGDGSSACEPTSPVPGTPRAVATEPLADRCRERAVRLPQQLDQPCAVVIQPPFVLSGDLSEAELRAKFAELIQPTCDALLAGYFRDLPDRPVTILMFSEEAAYRRAAEQLFFDRHVSRFGYYKPGRQTVLVNLAEGDGGLLHELTHVLMDADFPAAPHWLQEGLAALHEASDVRTCGESAASGISRLVPHHNWRLTVLRRAVAENRLPQVKELITASDFRGSSESLDYAYARYFCWFLHDRGKLRQLYVTLRERSAPDPTGAATLLELLADPDWASIDRQFRAWLDAVLNRPS